MKIGNICPYTGPVAAVGLGMRNSMDLHIRQANASGKFPEYNIQLVALDDASDPATGVSMATKLGSDPDVIGVSAHFNSPVALATVHIFHRFGLANVLSNTVHPDVILGNDYKEITRIVADVTTEQAFGGNFVIGKYGYRSWCVIHDTTAWGKTRLEWFKKDLENRSGTKILSVDGVTVGTKDFRPLLTKIKALKPDAIFSALGIQEGSLLKIQMHELGMDNTLFYGPSAIDSDTFIEIAGKAAEGVVVIGMPYTSPESEFAKAYKAAGYAEPYESYGPFAYDAAGIMLEGLRRFGPSRQAIVNYVADPKFEYNGVTGLIKLKNRQTMTGGLTMKVCQDGKWIPFEKSEYATGKRKFPGK